MDILANFGNGLLIETLTGTRALVNADPIMCKLDPGGTHRDVTLDGITSSTGPGSTGRVRVIINAADAAENLVCKDKAGNTIGTVNQNEAGVFMSKSSDNAWTLAFMFTIALS